MNLESGVLTGLPLAPAIDVFANQVMNSHYTRTQYSTSAIAALLSVGLGLAGANCLASETSGYVAGYTWFGLVVIGATLVFSLLLVGAVLSFFGRTRWLGKLAMIAAVLIVASSFASFKILDALGKVRYKHEQMVPLVPERADLAIYFRTDATDDQIETFWQETLSTKQEKGYWPRPGISSTLRHLPVSGHEVVIVSFLPSATAAERGDIVSRARSSPIVHRVLENVPYREIEKPVGREGDFKDRHRIVHAPEPPITPP